MATVRDALYELLRELNLTTIFGNPGSTEESFLEKLPGDFRYVLGLHEASVVAMADGYAQNTGAPVLVSLHTAAGMGNAMGNIASAWHNHAPLIIIAGQQTREMLLLEPYLTNLRATLLPQPYVKWSYETVRAVDAPAALLRAYAAAVQPPAGPVFLSIPMDDLDAPYKAIPALRRISRSLQASPAALKETADVLAAARSPALIIGGAVDQGGGWDDAVRLADKLRCPVWAAPSEGRPGFPETHPQFQGSAPAAIGPLCKTLKGHDLVLVIGAPVFRYYPYIAGDYLPKGTRLIQISADPEETARAPVGHSRRWNAQRYRHARARARGPSVSPGAGHHPGQDVVSALDPGGLCKAAYGNEASRIRVQSIALEPHKQKLAYKFPGARFSRVHDFLRTILSC
jgi:benzoylformate decarboxylase